MHNLAFHGGAKSHYVAHPNAIDYLVHAVGDDDARCATSACAALFALSRHGQRVVATLASADATRRSRGGQVSTRDRRRRERHRG